MSGSMPPLLQYAFMAWCSVKAQGQLYLYLTGTIPSTLLTDRQALIDIPALTVTYRE